MSDYYDINTGEEVSDYDAHVRFDEYLDEVLDDVTVGSLTFAPSRALKELDPIAYRCEFSDWTSDDENGLVESGYWVRVLTDDGEILTEGGSPVLSWHTDEEDAREAFAQNVHAYQTEGDAGDTVTVQLYDTSDDIIAEERVTA